MDLTGFLLAQTGVEVYSEPSLYVIGTSEFSVQINDACSGYEGIGLAFVFISVYVWLFRESLRFPAALALVPVTMALMWIANSFRIAALVLIGHAGSPEVALGGFHSQAGSILFAGICLGIVALVQNSTLFTRQSAAAERASSPAAPWLMPMLALLAVMMATQAMSAGGFDALYPVRVIVVGGVIWHYRRMYSMALWTWSVPAVAMGLAVFALWIALEPVGSADAAANSPSNPSHLAPHWAALWLAFRVVGSIITVPIAEELAFRGFLLRRLVAEDFQSVSMTRFTWLSFLASSLLFGLMHGRVVAGTLAGMGFALVMYRRGRLGEAVVAHSVANIAIAVYVPATGHWSMW
jgi:exosortase E/protease (VPEID-CTERM system)